MLLAVPIAISHSGAPYHKRSFYIFREADHLPKNIYFMVVLPKNTYFMVVDIEMLKNILKIKYMSINFISLDHIVFL